jgi:tellurite resistance protein
MSQSIYETIQPLIAHAEQQGSTMRVVFRCPVSGYETEAGAGLRQSSSMGSRMAGSVKRSLMWSVRSAIASAVRSAFGHGIVGNVVAGASREAVQAGEEKLRYSEADQRDAIERAFQSVSDRFVWNAQQGRYVAAQAGGEVSTGFMRQLGDAPATTRYDRLVSARMLIEIASADGQLGQDEHMFVSGFITPDLGSVEELWRAPRLSAAELAETSEGPVRDTMLILAWAVAWTDERLAPEEEARLREYATALAVPAARVAELQGHVRTYLLDQALARAYAGGRLDPAAHAEAMEFARRLGLDATTAERTDIRFRKRNGLI